MTFSSFNPRRTCFRPWMVQVPLWRLRRVRLPRRSGLPRVLRQPQRPDGAPTQLLHHRHTEWRSEVWKTKKAALNRRSRMRNNICLLSPGILWPVVTAEMTRQQIFLTPTVCLCLLPGKTPLPCPRFWPRLSWKKWVTILHDECVV